MCHIFVGFSLVDGHLGYFILLVIVTRASKIMDKNISVIK